MAGANALGAIARTLQSIDAGKRFPDAVALLEAIVEHFADAAAVLAQQLTETLDLIEDHVIDDAMRDEQRRLGPVRRTAVRLHRQLASLRVLFQRWSKPSEAELPSRVGVAAGRLAQRLEGLDQEIVALQERARLLQDEIAAKLATETNRHLFVLSIATVFLLPPTLVAGIFGMNVSDLPFTKATPAAFPGRWRFACWHRSRCTASCGGCASCADAQQQRHGSRASRRRSEAPLRQFHRQVSLPRVRPDPAQGTCLLSCSMRFLALACATASNTPFGASM